MEVRRWGHLQVQSQQLSTYCMRHCPWDTDTKQTRCLFLWHKEGTRQNPSAEIQENFKEDKGCKEECGDWRKPEPGVDQGKLLGGGGALSAET
jgi:hypothetical protein